MFQEQLGRAETLIAKGDHKHGGQELYEVIFKAQDTDDLHAVQSVIDRELDRAGWRQRGRYKELKRVVEKHAERRQTSAAA